MSTFKAEVREILDALQQLQSRTARYPLSAEDIYQCALLLANAQMYLGHMTAAMRDGLHPTTSGRNPSATRAAVDKAATAHDLLLRISHTCEDAYVVGGDAADYLRAMTREPGFTL